MTTVVKALSDDTRRQILKLLANGDMTAKEISENFTISKPAISKHLDILKEARLVTSERTGPGRAGTRLNLVSTPEQ